MSAKHPTAILVLLIAALTCPPKAAGLEPNEVLVIANRDMSASVDIARYYCRARQIPGENLLMLKLGKNNPAWIARDRYNKSLAEPIRNHLLFRKRKTPIRCLLTTYGVPYKVGTRGAQPDTEPELQRLTTALAEEQDKESPKSRALQAAIDRIKGVETNASVDSELSLVLFPVYELYRWQPNALKGDLSRQNSQNPKTLMVCRLDGPTPDIVKGLVDKALIAEQNGLSGKAYIDTRGGFERNDMYGQYDKDLRTLSDWLKTLGRWPVILEDSGKLFGPNDCPDTALYCGWYSLKKYIDAFDFNPGAIGYHIASWEAVDLRDANSTEWCPAMLMDGITATLGAVSEPYLQSFPAASDFFQALYHGHCLVEAFYLTKPFNSWQMLLIGDPLYRPFAHVTDSSSQ